VDYGLVHDLRRQVAESLREERRQRAAAGSDPLAPSDERQYGRSLILRALEQHRLGQSLAGHGAADDLDNAELAEAVHAALFGMGRLQPLLEDASIANIDINGFDEVWIDRTDGRRERARPVADSDAELVELVRTVATYTGLSSRAWDVANPWLVMRLPDGSRLSALMAVVDRPHLSIRCYRLQKVLLEDLFDRGGFSRQVGAFLQAAVGGRQNVMISGETFAGKTTLLRALGNEVPAGERIITVEHFRELGFKAFPDLHPNTVELEERPANSEGVGAVTLDDLVEMCRRLSPDRLIVGEVIGGEIVAMLDAMTQGEDGSLSTIHARDSRMVFQRIAAYAIKSHYRLPVEASHMLTAGALDFVVHLTKRAKPDGTMRRFVSSVREVVGSDGTQVVSSEVFAAQTGGVAVAAAPVTDQRAAVLAEHGYDQSEW
jgi:pilus assembly protein CpaF